MSVVIALSTIFMVIFVGYLAGKKKLFDKNGLDILNNFAFYIAMPALIFLNISRSTWQGTELILFAISITIAIICVITLIFIFGVFIFKKKLSELAIQASLASFPNVIYAGFPIIIALFPKNYLPPAIIAAVIFNVISINISVLILEIAKTTGNKTNSMVKYLTKSLLMNPIISPSILGGLISYSSWSLPNYAIMFLELVSSPAAPIGLFIIGLSLALYGLKVASIYQIIWPIFLKLVIQPIIVAYFVLYIFQLENIWALPAIIMAALPCGVVSFTLARRYSVYSENAATAVFISTILSMLSLSILINIFL